MKKLVFLSLFLGIGISNTTQAASINKNLLVSSNIQSTCVIRGEDFLYKDLDFTKEIDLVAKANVYIKCNGNTIVNLEQNGLTTSGEKTSSNNILALNGQNNQVAYSYFIYKIFVDNSFASNENATITKISSSRQLQTGTNALQLKFINSIEIGIPLSAKLNTIDNNILAKVRPGKYKDTIVYTLSF